MTNVSEAALNAIIAGIASNNNAIDQAHQILENLKFAGYALASRQDAREAWQPIETAPKDGTFVLAVEAGRHSETGAPYVPDTVRWFEDRWDNGWCESDFIYRPTHWMSLPTPPSGVEHSPRPTEAEGQSS